MHSSPDMANARGRFAAARRKTSVISVEPLRGGQGNLLPFDQELA
jgi:hypothetical protein